jgi:xanthine dehydrogenase YagS FAD-binding subunit
MNPFQYIAASTPQEAFDLAVDKKGRYLAGGIDLLGEMKDYIVSPDLLVALRPADRPDKVRPAVQHSYGGPVPADSVWLDFNITMAELAAHADIQAKFPGLAQAAGEVGSPQIRNVATLAGNLLQHSRCWYYRQPDITCLKRGGATCYAPDGENKYLSLFSGCACVSPIVSNTAIALAALDARIHFSGGSRLKTAPFTIDELYSAAWTNPQAHNSLKEPLVIDGIVIPATRTHSAYRQQSEKSEFDWALVSCAAAGNVRDGKIYDARVALGAVAPVPYMVHAAQHYLEGKALTDETASAAADLMLKDAKPLSQNGYKIPLAHTLIRRTLLALNS